ncbi:MAG TPA: hypothetical protein VGJ79_01540 [Candidatus Dormibacteraeota bacterium]|jgi:hypothetical protein
MLNRKAPSSAETTVFGRPSERLFYRLFLPVAVTANLVLGLIILSGLRPYFWTEWLEVATGAFCCIVAGGLAAAAWSKFYWGRAMAHQILVWRRIADAFFFWLEDAPLPAEALHRLQTSLDEAVPNRDRG